MDQNESKMQIAVLIDSENVSSRYASIIFNEIETYGFATYRRIYGNWTKNNGWSENILLENSITPIQQFNYTSGKNSSDMTMVIDAMDILYSGNVDGFCLVTSDSDFTRHTPAGSQYVRDWYGRIQNPCRPHKSVQQIHPSESDF